VWDITPEKMHPATAAEDYLGDYQEGWLTFESEAERRRLARVPPDWDRFPEEELEWLLDAARVVAHRTPGARTGQAPALPGKPLPQRRPEEGRLTPPSAPGAVPAVRRIFQDPRSGRVVTVCVERLPIPTPPPGGKAVASSPGAVLRFKTEDKRVFDLARWPDDWERLPRERLADLFHLAQQEAEREAVQREEERRALRAETDVQRPPPPTPRLSDDPGG
jgi:hypothetical protein